MFPDLVRWPFEQEIALERRVRTSPEHTQYVSCSGSVKYHSGESCQLDN